MSDGPASANCDEEVLIMAYVYLAGCIWSESKGRATQRQWGKQLKIIQIKVILSDRMPSHQVLTMSSKRVGIDLSFDAMKL